MTDDDFDKVDEDFASEFDFVDNNNQQGAQKTSQNTAAPPPQPKGSSGIVTLMVIISILGGGYYAYSHFFAKKPTVPTSPQTKTTDIPELPGVVKDELPTMPEHANETMQPSIEPIGPAQNASAPNMPTESQTKKTPEEVAEQLESNNNELATSVPMQTNEKSFEQMQKDIQTAKQAQTPQPTQQMQQSQPVVPSEVRNALQTISEDITENVNNIRQLEGAISNVAISLDQLNRTISAMDNRVVSLSDTVESLSQDLSNVKKVMIDQDLDLTMPGNVKKSTSSKKQMQTISSSEPNYSVHAIIPGRAWLKSANGQIITVTEGDKIGDYGTVAVIDAANSLVRTSSGIIIR